MPTKTATLRKPILGTTNPTFAGARDATSGTVFTSPGGSAATVHTNAVMYSKVAGARGNSFNINRYFIEFDTSDISVTPADATLQIPGSTNSSANFFAVKATFSDGSLANGDFDAIDGWTAGADNSSNVTKYSSEVTSWSTGAYNNITLNSTALSDMANNDTFKICLIEADFDLTNTAPSDTTVRRTGMSFANDGEGNIRDPKIDYTEGSAVGYGHDVVGVAAANIGKIKGVATANVGKVIGVD